MRIRSWLGLLTVVVLLSGCQLSKQSEVPILKVMTHESFQISAELVEKFEQQTNSRLEFVQFSDAGTLVNSALLNQQSPLADVLYGVDNTFVGRALEEDLFVPYRATEVDMVKEGLRSSAMRDFVTPISYGDVCLNYDKAWFEDNQLPLPANLSALLSAQYRDLVVVTNPALSSPGLAFLLSTIDEFGEEGYEQFWEELLQNGAKIVNSWSGAYYGEFSATGEGTRPIVLSYATSPAAEVFYGEVDTSPTAVVEAGCFRQIEYVGILANTSQELLAQQWVDFMLSQEFQTAIPTQMWVFPVRTDITLPEVFVLHAQEISSPREMDYERINSNREIWLKQFEELIRRAR